ncbi:Guanosine polyphosphate pyrophosphohydrolase/synthetase [Enhygromyxa salina]|uniref:Guanosine polyphosphate pyrophosphohydrolase/synthetase n=1 Tax=Enhygromyxa salina TaxID=215803 RepID=A0A0C2A0S8_9BACT|nr:HD domain-containing protein [Enhygromyxa salina]KIG17013.1 Guanosine polyphosphate pyrophosphohydrolase/synthetase [Enhygromyxa salina]
MSLWSPDAWLEAWRFAADAHHGQRVPGSEHPYIVHVAAVAMEVAHAISVRAQLGDPVARPDLAIQCALLHDVVEDTSITASELAVQFGDDVAAGVSALSKDPSVGDKPAQMRDSLARIRLQGPEIWMVKLGDRITNLQAPPSHWEPAKIRSYRDEAQKIHAQLGGACSVLGPRLQAKISAYEQFT